MLSKYEQIREANIKRNRELLTSMELEHPLFEPKEKPRPNPVKVKRKAPSLQDTEDASSRTKKRVRQDDATATSNTSSSDGGLRRSSRRRNAVDYTKEQIIVNPLPIFSKAPVSEARALDKRTQDPKTYGAIPGIEIGTWWETREACSVDAVHAPFVAGISGGPDGAFSVALSGGYEDDVDLGYAFTYTGSGGRDLKGSKTAPKNLRTAPQSSDQSFENTFNRALLKSSESKKPVRVVRGYKLESPYAPSEGYRYDGLYSVEKAWTEKGLNPKGFLVCKFAFKRLPNQQPLPRKDIECNENGGVEED